MVTKGIIKSIDFNGNSCIVRMPYFETAGVGEVVCEALISNVPGVYNGYKEDDVVWIAFEDGMIETPVIVGKLYLGAAKEKEDPRGTVNCINSLTSQNASIPFDTQLSIKHDLDSIRLDSNYSTINDMSFSLHNVITESGQTTRIVNELINKINELENRIAELENRS